MRYQPRFLGVVPHPGVGCPRVPHPSAADPPRRAGPRDLHALGTPPALFLSQDQTLWQIPTWGISSLVVSPAARGGAAHDTVHAPARTRSRIRPEAHAPLSTCQGPGLGGRKRRSSRAARGRLSIRSLVVAVARWHPPLSVICPVGARPAPRGHPPGHNRMVPHTTLRVKPFDSTRLIFPRREWPLARGASPVSTDGGTESIATMLTLVKGLMGTPGRMRSVSSSSAAGRAQRVRRTRAPRGRTTPGP